MIDSRSQTNHTIRNKILKNTKHGYKAKHGYIHAHIHKSTKQNCLIQTRPAQHMTCSPGQVLHRWHVHSPPNPSQMRKLIRKFGRRSHPKD